nr:alpha/beta fold hydrolase [Paenibacillus sp. Marseille-Q4541]
MKAIQLFCLPYAGGSSFMFEPVQTYMREWIEVIPIDYAGHGLRIMEDFYTDFQQMVSDVATQIIERLNGKPFAILGYSMGSLIAYEVYYEICKRTERRPIHLFFAAHVPPDFHIRTEELTYALASKRLEANLVTMGGGNVLVQHHRELLEMITPRYHIDLTLYSNYLYCMKENLIEANITIIFSEEDNKNNQMYEWSKHTSKFCLFQKVKGNHFFINTETEEMAKILNRVLITELSI